MLNYLKGFIWDEDESDSEVSVEVPAFHVEWDTEELLGEIELADDAEESKQKTRGQYMQWLEDGVNKEWPELSDMYDRACRDTLCDGDFFIFRIGGEWLHYRAVLRKYPMIAPYFGDFRVFDGYLMFRVCLLGDSALELMKGDIPYSDEHFAKERGLLGLAARGAREEWWGLKLASFPDEWPN